MIISDSVKKMTKNMSVELEKNDITIATRLNTLFITAFKRKTRNLMIENDNTTIRSIVVKTMMTSQSD
jgi:hypothetical protein